MNRGWRFRHKLLAVIFLPVIWAFTLLALVFSFRLENVWRDAVSMQAGLLRLESLCREFQSEIREFVLLGEDETFEEITEILAEFSDALEHLQSGNALAVQMAEDLEPQIEHLMNQGERIIAVAKEIALTQVHDELGDDLENFEALEEALEEQIDVERSRAELEVLSAFEKFQFWIFTCAALGCLSAFVLALFLARSLNKPLQALQKASERILDGDYRAQDHVQSQGELGRLAMGFDRAASEIRQLMKEKEESLEALELNQAQLLQSAKMAAVGELAAGVAHEINNPLSAVLTYSVLLREKAEAAPPGDLASMPKLIERLELIEAAGLRCRGISQKLLSFSRQDDEEKGPVDMAEVVDASIELVAATLRQSRIVVIREFEADTPPVHGSVNQLQQIFINLINNAVYAMPEGGRLSIRVRRQVHRGPGPGEAPGAQGYCEVAVNDDGHGIEPSIRERLFEPFVTTKPAGEGTGLGLSIVHGLVQNHGGEISVESEASLGTTFTFVLPLSSETSRENFSS